MTSEAESSKEQKIDGSTMATLVVSTTTTTTTPFFLLLMNDAVWIKVVGGSEGEALDAQNASLARNDDGDNNNDDDDDDKTS